MQAQDLTRNNIIEFLADLLDRVGAESYLGEAVSQTEHWLQAAYQAELAGESPETITAALLHDIGHYTGEFPENYIELGVNNRHETLGARILEKNFPPEVTEPVRWHVEAKRYLCAVEPEYFDGLSDASVDTLRLQGGPLNEEEVAEFEKLPMLDTIVRVRRYDDAAKVPGARTPGVEHYLDIARSVMTEAA